MGLFSFVSILFFGYFTIPSFILGILWTDFVLKVFFGPEYSPIGAVAKRILGEKPPYYVGAMQKRFAWSIGLFLSSLAFLCILIVSGFLPSMGIALAPYEIVQAMEIIAPFKVPFTLPLFACLICIVFMTLEAGFGYCAGCAIYAKLVQWGWMKRREGQNCAGGVCDISKR